MTRIGITKQGKVDCRAKFRLPLSASQAWGQIRGFHTFARQEFFHAGIDVEGDVPRQGARLVIYHQFFLFRVRRVGRICRWREGKGFAFSDMSTRGVRAGFPHVFGYNIEPNSPASCTVEIRVAGRWTATFIPRPLTWLWLRWVMQHAAHRVENELLLYRLWLNRRNLPRG